MKISFVVCGNGYGHLKRVIQVMDHILVKDERSVVQVITGSTHEVIVDEWLANNSARKDRVTFVNGFTENNLGNNLKSMYSFSEYKDSLDVIERHLKKFNPDTIVSDNLAGVLGGFPQAILMGSFLWADVLEKKNSDIQRICDFENTLLDTYKPLMIGVKDMVMDFVKEKTSFTGLPWFCERPATSIPPSNRKIHVLITGGGTTSLTKELLEIADALIIDSKEIIVSLDSKLYEASNKKEFSQPFSFTDQDFSLLDWIICRPGIGILNDAVKYRIPVCAVVEENKEIKHNAEKVESLLIGIQHRDILSTKKTIENNDTQNFRDALCLMQTGGAARAAEIILNLG